MVGKKEWNEGRYFFQFYFYYHSNWWPGWMKKITVNSLFLQFCTSCDEFFCQIIEMRVPLFSSKFLNEIIKKNFPLQFLWGTKWRKKIIFSYFSNSSNELLFIILFIFSIHLVVTNPSPSGHQSEPIRKL